MIQATIHRWNDIFFYQLFEQGKINIELCSFFTQTNTKTLSRYFQQEYQKLKTPSNQNNWWIEVYGHTFQISELSSKWYFNAEKLWEFMSIDEKDLCWEVYSIISNPRLWAKWLVGIIPWIKAHDIKTFILLHSKNHQRWVVKEVSLDMANTMQNIVAWVFLNAVQVVDRFHVMKHVLEDMWALISKQKTEEKKQYFSEQEQAKIERRKPSHARYFNWETLLEIITRWRHQLLKRRTNWNLRQKLRWSCFKNLPQLQNIAAMYEQVEEVFAIYDAKICKKQARKRFERWFMQISKLDFIDELQNSWRLIRNHFDRILNYFRHRLTNGYAEGLNSRMQRIISNARWFKDKDYMVYRMIKIFG